MEAIKKTINIYGDTLVEINSEDALNVFLTDIKENTQSPYIIHYKSNNTKPEIILNFKHITYRKGIHVYANDAVIKKCPKLINEHVSGSAVVLQVKYEDSLYNVFVKDRTKKYITNPAGTLEYNESYEKCAIRECKEETGLNVDINESDMIGSFGYVYTLFEMKWPGEAKIYKCIKEVTKEEFNTLKSFECDEIEKIHLVPSHSLQKELSIEGVPISAHHLLAARYVHFNIDWESEKPTYLIDFKLF